MTINAFIGTKNEYKGKPKYRSAEHEKDYRGGCNQYSDLQGLQYNVNCLFHRLCAYGR